VRAIARARRRLLACAGVTALAVAGLAVTGPAEATTPSASTVGSDQPAAAPDPLAVYFRHDAVGRAQLALAATTCGTERWTVKTASDDDRRLIATSSRDVSVRYLRNRSTPAVKPQTSRVAPVELTTYRVHARLTEYVREADGDYHLVLTDHAGRTIIAEVPDPGCVASISPLKGAIRVARAHADAHLAVTSGFKAANRRVVVRGVGFFDYFHGQTGMAPNDLELHPVIGLRFS
jgi:hypothetical protein